MDWGRVGLGVATGGASETSRAALGLLGGGGGGGRRELEALETPEQREARQRLLKFAETGQFGDFKAGAEIPLGYGDYGMTDIEGEGLTTLAKLMRSVPEQYRLGDEALRDILSTNPDAIERQFEPFNALTERAMRDSETALKRGAGFAGNLYSTDTIRKLGDVQVRGNESKMAELARLNDAALNRRLAAVPLALQSAESQERHALGRVAASQELGSLTRRLNDAKIKARDAEVLRRRSELQLPIAAATSIIGAPVQFGVKGIDTPSPYQELLALVGQVGGTALGTYLGGPAGGAVGARAGGAVASAATPGSKDFMGPANQGAGDRFLNRIL